MKAQQRQFFSLPPTHCEKCGRLLTDPDSIRRGIGPVCAGHGRLNDLGENDMEDFCDFTLFDPITDGLIMKRDDRGVWTNCPHLVTHHSPSGFEFGYGGSGPADLALNVVEILLNHLNYRGERVKCWRGDCWDKAFELHQGFKLEFIAPAERNGEVIPYPMMLGWVQNFLLE